MCILHCKVTLQVYLEIPTQARKEHLASSRTVRYIEKRTGLWENLGEQVEGQRQLRITHPPEQIMAFFFFLLENQLLNIYQHAAVYKQDPRGTS